MVKRFEAGHERRSFVMTDPQCRVGIVIAMNTRYNSKVNSAAIETRHKWILRMMTDPQTFSCWGRRS